MELTAYLVEMGSMEVMEHLAHLDPQVCLILNYLTIS